jgi:hypothetical protein
MADGAGVRRTVGVVMPDSAERCSEHQRQQRNG